VTLRVVPPAAWKDWDAAAWGRALLRHYFAGRDSRPVSRLAISPEELARAAGAPDTSAAAVQDAFLEAVRCSPTAFRRRLSTVSIAPRAWNRAEEPPFLAYLFLTCVAAASLNAAIADEGVFRERVRRLLEHDEGTSYAFDELSLLWETFAEWLKTRRDEGAAYRVLSLPDRGRMRRIGYSVRLAFPRREDRVRLRDVLAAARVLANPTVPEVLQAIDRGRDQFSPDFRHVYDRARAAAVSGRDNSELHALWSAVLEAAALASPTERRHVRARFQLLAQEDDFGRLDPFVVATGTVPAPAREARTGVRFSPLDEPADEFDHFVSATDGTIGRIADLLLMGALEDRVPGLANSPIPRAVRDGVLLFRQRDSATWELAVTRPNEGRARALVRAPLSEPFVDLLRGATGPARETRFDGWSEIAPFDLTQLPIPSRREAPALAAIRCLQRVEVGPQLHLVGGIRVDGGYLGLPGLLPEVHCAGADRAVLFRLVDSDGEERSENVATLEPVTGRPGVFGWPAEPGELEGPYVLAGMRASGVIAPREVLFRGRGLRHDYRGPTHPERWLVEASVVDVVAAGPPPHAGSEAVSDGFLTTRIGATTRLSPFDPASHGAVDLLLGRSVDDDPAHDRLVETLAAVAATRQGVPEGELIEVLAKLLPHAPGFRVWGIVRGWVEAGYLDCLTRRLWRGRVYFARRPRMVLMPEVDAITVHPASGRATAVRGVLHGLAPYRLRNAVQRAFVRAGAPTLPAMSLSPFVPAPAGWRFASLEHAAAAMLELGESEGAMEVVGVPDPRDLVGAFDSAVSDEAPLPPGYERDGVWDWATGGFRRAIGSTSTGEVRIERFTRTNGPDRYVILSDDRRRTTLSRSWALLEGHRRAGKAAFVGAGPTVLVRPGDDGPQVPLPLARALGLRAAIVAGPAESTVFGAHYAYASESAAVRRWLLGWLNGATIATATDRAAGPVAARRFAWLRAATAGYATAMRRIGAVAIPADLRRRLRALDSIPDALALSEQCLPRHLLPHVRRAIELAEA